MSTFIKESDARKSARSPAQLLGVRAVCVPPGLPPSTQSRNTSRTAILAYCFSWRTLPAVLSPFLGSFLLFLVSETKRIVHLAGFIVVSSWLELGCVGNFNEHWKKTLVRTPLTRSNQHTFQCITAYPHALEH